MKAYQQRINPYLYYCPYCNRGAISIGDLDFHVWRSHNEKWGEYWGEQKLKYPKDWYKYRDKKRREELRRQY